jgi:GcrA cell cycle regulator
MTPGQRLSHAHTMAMKGATRLAIVRETRMGMSIGQGRRARNPHGRRNPGASASLRTARENKQRAQKPKTLYRSETDTPPVVAYVPPMEQRKILVQLENNYCRYPLGHVGEPGFAFCGGEKHFGVPYCTHHAHVCFVPSKPNLNTARTYNPSPARETHKKKEFA